MATSPYQSFFAQQYQQDFVNTLTPIDINGVPTDFSPTHFAGNGTAPPPQNAGSTLVVGGGTNTTIAFPEDSNAVAAYTAVEDRSNNDILTSDPLNSLVVFLDHNTTYTADTGGSQQIISIGADTINAGFGANTVQGSAAGTTVNGAGSTSIQFFGGSGNASIVGAAGINSYNILVGSQGSGSTYLQAGLGNNTLIGGSGGGVSKLVGGNNTYEFAAGAGPTTMVAGEGVTIANGQTGSGAELGITGSGYLSLALNNANDTVVGGSGNSAILGGAGQDIYGFINGHAGGSETIFDLNTSTDALVFGGYNGSPIASEAVGAAGDVLRLTDGTSVTLAGVDHTLFT